MEVELKGGRLTIALTLDERAALARGEDLEVPKDAGFVVVTSAAPPAPPPEPPPEPAPDAEIWAPAIATANRVMGIPEADSPGEEPAPTRVKAVVADPYPGQTITCQRCGRQLTNPTSKGRGMGPVCAARAIVSGGDEPFDQKIARLEQLLAEAEAGGEDTAGIKALIAQLQEADVPPSDGEKAAAWVEQVFTTVFPRIMPGYEPREPQVKLAREIAIAMATGEHIAAEAGTGTGKSLAYLVPAVWWAREYHRPVVVTTGTIALQEQLIGKDIPFLQRALAEEAPFTAALVKGKGNYLCKLKAEDEFKKQGLIPDPDWPRLVDWMQTTDTGDKAAIQGWVPPAELWNRVNVDDTCLKRDCPSYNSCHLYNAKRRAKEAEILVCNHSLYMADVQIRMSSDDGASILPPHAVAVFDEGHHIEDVASESFGAEITQFKIPSLIRDLRRIGHPDIPQQEMDLAVQANDTLFAIFPRIEPRVDKQALRRLDDWEQIRQLVLHLAGALKNMSQKLGELDFRHSDEKIKKRIESIGDRAAGMFYTLHDMAEGEPEWVDVAEVNWSRDKPVVTLRRSPISVAGLLREYIWAPIHSAACLSATISSGGSFNYFKRQVGLDDCGKTVRELIADSPFDYPTQSMLYVPRGLPDPGNENYGTAIQPIIMDILTKTQGRAFVLFTSYRQMQATHKALAPQLRSAGYTVFMQGEKSRSELVADFKADIHSVLFATSSFWEGVDVQGEALSCVIIDKIPFDSPGDPLLEARQKAIDAGGGNSFMQFSVPRAVIKLKQGVGRLIRTRADRGVVAILDNRLRTKPYGRVFLKSLPPMREIVYLDDVPAFLAGGEKQ